MKQVEDFLILTIIIGIACVAFGAYKFYSSKYITDNNEEAVGHVIEFADEEKHSYPVNKYWSNNEALFRKPVIEFVTNNGVEVSFVPKNIETLAFSIHDKVAVVYDPVNPEKAKLKPADRQLLVYISGTIGVFLILSGLFWIVIKRKSAKREV